MRWIVFLGALTAACRWTGLAAAYQPAPPQIAYYDYQVIPSFRGPGRYDAADVRPRTNLLRVGLLLLPPRLGRLLPIEVLRPPLRLQADAVGL